MRKKILVAEQSDAIRNIAESILHQNGFDVISSSEGDKARALIISEQPNLIIIGADLKDSDGGFLYESLGENKATSSIPLLLIEDPNGHQVPYPPEVVLSRPFEPGDFLDKISTFVGIGDAKSPEKISTSSPFGGGGVDDEFLDAALGIDEIEVEDSEIMDKTWTGGQASTMTPKKDVYDIVHHTNGENGEGDDSGKVESLMIRDEEDNQVKTGTLTESSKIQLDNDQYGMTNAPEETEPEPEKTDHDYDWFLNEMQKDGEEKETTPEEKKIGNDTDSNIHLKNTGEMLEPLSTPGKKDSGTDKNTGGVDQFISDFKEEMKQISDSGDENQKVADEKKLKEEFESELDDISAQSIETAKPSTVVDEPSQPVDADEIRRIGAYMVELLAERLAKSIVEKIDKDEIYQIIKEELPNILAEKK